jgi:SAM-dependent methyltransferase
MISAELMEAVACPVCLEPSGCARCSAPTGHEACAAYVARAACSCGGPDKVRLERTDGGLRCTCCASVYLVADGHLALSPPTAVGEGTLYADEEFHERMEVTDAPPVLSAGVKADMSARMLGLGTPGAPARVLDLGCGAGKFALHAAAQGARVTGIDLAPFFLPRAVAGLDLVQGDLRRLPFRKGTFDAGYTLDVLEHLDEPGVVEILVEARRVMKPGAGLFVYTHAMESSRLAGFQRAVNRLARRLGSRGLIDHEREALRKSDHRNAIRSHEHFDELAARAGLGVVARRYYNVVLKAVVEDLLLRLWEQRRRKARGAPEPMAPEHDDQHEHDHAHHHHHASGPRPAPTRAVLAVAHALTWLLKLDVVLFGGVRTGPFFGLLRPR